MERAGHAMAAQSRKPQYFGHHTLAGERRIAVEQQRQHFRAVFQWHDLAARAAGNLILLGAGFAHHHRVDNLQMRRVRRQGQVHLVAIEFAIRRCAKVILHVTRALDIVRRVGASLEFMEDGAVRLRHHL